MKAVLTIACSLLIITSCSSPDGKAASQSNALKLKIETYAKGKPTEPESYKTISITEKSLVTDTILIKECYYRKYARTIDNNKGVDSSPIAKNINEKFYSVNHEFQATNLLGFTRKAASTIFLDSSDTILYSERF